MCVRTHALHEVMSSHREIGLDGLKEYCVFRHPPHGIKSGITKTMDIGEDTEARRQTYTCIANVTREGRLVE